MAAPSAATPKPAMSHAFWWGLFAVGGMVAALLVPVHILLQGVLGPLGVVPVVGRVVGSADDPVRSYESLRAAVANPLVKLYLFVLISLPFFHAAHRLRYFVLDLGLQGARGAVAFLFYAAAVAGTLITAYILLTMP